MLFICTRWFLRLRVALTLVACPLAQAEFVVVMVRRRRRQQHQAVWQQRGIVAACITLAGSPAAAPTLMPALPAPSARPPRLRPPLCVPPLCKQLVDKQQDLVRVQRMASFNSINIQASSSASHHAHSHVLSEDELPLAAAAAAAAADTAALKGGDGYDRLLEYRCGRYLYHHGEATFLPVAAMPADFAATLHTVAGSRNVKGKLVVACSVGAVGAATDDGRSARLGLRQTFAPLQVRSGLLLCLPACLPACPPPTCVPPLPATCRPAVG